MRVSERGDDVTLAEGPDLIARAQLGDAAAFGELARRHRLRAYQTALRILRNAEDAEDIVQEAMISAYRHIDSFRGDSAFTTWLTRIVINVSLMQLRKKKRRNELYLEDPMGEQNALMELVASNLPSPESELIERQRVTLLWRWMGELPASLREIMMERVREGVSVDELAARRGISVAAAKSRLLRARHFIHERASRASETVPELDRELSVA